MLFKTNSTTPAISHCWLTSNLVFSAGPPDSIKTFLGAVAATRHAGNGDYALVCGIAITWTVACNLWDFHDTMCVCVFVGAHKRWKHSRFSFCLGKAVVRDTLESFIFPAAGSKTVEQWQWQIIFAYRTQLVHRHMADQPETIYSFQIQMF